MNNRGLSAVRIRNLSTPGRFHDKNGLYLQVSKSRTKSWIFRYKKDSKIREMGLGSLKIISLADARGKVLQYRKLLLDGIDPIDSRANKKLQDKAELANKVTFNKCAKDYIDSRRLGWSNQKHASQWENTLRIHAIPIIGNLPVHKVDLSHILQILEPIWRSKTETADRVRNRIELILDWASVMGFRSGANPARWRGHLDKLLPQRSKVQPVKHFSAVPIREIGNIVTYLRLKKGTSFRALEFLILTVARTGEVLGATWDEINFDQEIWIIPASRMKSRKEHRVPISKDALSLLLAQKETSDSIYIFPGNKHHRPLSTAALLVILRKIGRAETIHGFRSTFRDWAAEHTNFPREVCELALAHSNRDRVEAAYLRGDSFFKRKKLMEEWAKFCAKRTFEKENLISLKNESNASVPY